MHKGELRLRPRELLAHRREQIQQPTPCRTTFLKSQPFGQRVLCRHAGACHSVVEPQNPDPAALEYMVQRGVIDRVRGVFHCITEPRHIREVRVERLRLRVIGKRCFLQSESAIHEAARACRVDQKPAAKSNGLAEPFSSDGHTIGGFAHRGKRDPVKIVHARHPPLRARRNDRNRRGTNACPKLRHWDWLRPATAVPDRERRHRVRGGKS